MSLKNQYLIPFMSICLLCVGLSSNASAEEDGALEFSGFARLVAGYLNEENSIYSNYENHVSLETDSLLGLRADLELSKKFSLVGQVILFADEQRDSRVQWLYLNYQPSRDWNFKFGRQRAPLFLYSEAIDVGFAYPWITLPSQVYNPFVFSDFDGILATYEFSTQTFSGSFDAYYGEYNGDVGVFDTGLDVEVDDFAGIVGTVSLNNFSFRAAYHRADAEIAIDELEPFKAALRQFGFERSAAALKIDDEVKYRQFSASWDNLDYFTRFEYTNLISDALFIPNLEGFYLTLGYNFYPYTAHLTLTHSDVRYNDGPNEIPIGINPQLDFLAAEYDATSRSLAIPEVDSVILGLRYELRSNIALKADVTFLRSGERFGPPSFVPNPIYLADDAELFQLALEWVF